MTAIGKTGSGGRSLAGNRGGGAMSAALFGAFVASLAGCASDRDGEADIVDAGVFGGDLGPDGGLDGGLDDCTAPSALPPGLLQGAQATGSEAIVAVFRPAQPSPPFDVYELELWTNVAPFTGAITPGTYAIESAQTDYGTCGVCVLLLGDANEVLQPRQHYIAESGVVTIDSVDESSISGTISDVSMVSFNNGPPGRCRTFVGATSFAASIRAL